MKLAERVESIRVALSLFPRCVRCNGDMSGERLSNLVIEPNRPNRFAHRVCPVLVEADHAAD